MLFLLHSEAFGTDLRKMTLPDDLGSCKSNQKDREQIDHVPKTDALYFQDLVFLWVSMLHVSLTIYPFPPDFHALPVIPIRTHVASTLDSTCSAQLP